MSDRITVILSTYNRASVLRETLESFCELDLSGLDVEFVIVDNNSSDATADVIQSFTARLPLVGLFHSVPGKNRALNHALGNVKLRDIVVFTDDDVTPRVDWLQQINAASKENPSYSVFGGKIEICWPNGEAPEWATAHWIQAIAFGLKSFGDETIQYDSGSYQGGANLWVHSSVFSGGLRYNEGFGPLPRIRIMGSETTFLIELENVGYLRLYVPTSIVSHRVQKSEVNRRVVARRAQRMGRSMPHIYGIPDAELYEQHHLRWYARRLREISKALAVWCRAAMTKESGKRFERLCWGRMTLGASVEAMRLSWLASTSGDMKKPRAK